VDRRRPPGGAASKRETLVWSPAWSVGHLPAAGTTRLAFVIDDEADPWPDLDGRGRQARLSLSALALRE
jgi:hypothetical protein